MSKLFYGFGDLTVDKIKTQTGWGLEIKPLPCSYVVTQPDISFILKDKWELGGIFFFFKINTTFHRKGTNPISMSDGSSEGLQNLHMTLRFWILMMIDEGFVLILAADHRVASMTLVLLRK